MDIIRFPKPTVGTTLNLSNADIVEGYNKATWIERYLPAGEFTIEADASSKIRGELPPGTLISHIGSSEMMIVENHHITSEDNDADKVSITGRSFETFLEQRVVGSNRLWSGIEYPLEDIILPQERTWVQAANLINYHIYDGYGPYDGADGFTNVQAMVIGALKTKSHTGFEVPRVVRRGELYKHILEILDVDSLGLKSTRAGSNEITFPDFLVLEIHEGVDRTRNVSFSHEFGDIESAEYLHSIKMLSNAALVSGRWVEVVVKDDLVVGYNRRWIHVDASDIDDKLTEVPTGPQLAAIQQLMTIRGKDELARRNEIQITNPKISKDSTRYTYRKDYEVGDIVGVSGEYNSSAKMRVIEHVEIDDDEGEVSYPTLAEL